MRLKNKIDSARVQTAIEAAEAKSSGEIVVSVAELYLGNIHAAAQHAFERLGVANTQLRNGVLLFIAPARRRFEIVADEGARDKVTPGFWDVVAGRLSQRFAAHEYTAGLVEAIETIGDELAVRFPRCAGDINELPDAPAPYCDLTASLLPRR